LTTAQVAEYCGVDRTEAYHQLLQKLDVRRIGIRGGAAPWGRLIRVERGSVLRLCGKPAVPAEVLPRWVTLKQAAATVRRLIADGELTGYRLGRSRRTVRVDLNEIDDQLMRPLNAPPRVRKRRTS
jgi:excisionase family DNA binding protein